MTAASPAGAEATSILQLLFFLVLGYTLTRLWLWTKARARMLSKKMEDIDQVCDDIQGVSCSESDATSSTQKAQRCSGVQRRKRKAAQTSPEVETVALPAAERNSGRQTLDVPEIPLPAVEIPPPAVEVTKEHEVAAPHEETKEVLSERVAKLMEKKAARKARKAEEMARATATTPAAQAELEGSVDDAGIASEAPCAVAGVAHDQGEINEDILEQTTVAACASDAVVEAVSNCSSPMAYCGTGVPVMEGWVAVAVPAECAPAGAPGPFDGLWTNLAKERIVIDHEDILFESGMKWVMEMTSVSTLSVTVGGEVFTATLDASAQQLLWSDNDVWTCVGQTDGQQQWASRREAEGMPPVLFEGEQQFQTMPMMAPMAIPCAPVVPQEPETWEVCWDWRKKGWCPRGRDCEWYPCAARATPWAGAQSMQGSCEPCNQTWDSPFAGSF